MTHEVIKALRAGETVIIEAGIFRMIPGEIEEGDWYIAERNTGPKLLTCKEVHERNFIVPVEMEYCYDTHECVRVELCE